MRKHLTDDKWKFLFLFLAIITFPESMKPMVTNNIVVLNVVFWVCFTWLVVNEQNNKASD
jgi:hypothetical protein